MPAVVVASFSEARYTTDQEGNVYVEFKSDDLATFIKSLKNEATNVLGGTE